MDYLKFMERRIVDAFFTQRPSGYNSTGGGDRGREKSKDEITRMVATMAARRAAGLYKPVRQVFDAARRAAMSEGKKRTWARQRATGTMPKWKWTEEQRARFSATKTAYYAERKRLG